MSCAIGVLSGCREFHWAWPEAPAGPGQHKRFAGLSPPLSTLPTTACQPATMQMDMCGSVPSASGVRLPHAHTGVVAPASCGSLERAHMYMCYLEHSETTASTRLGSRPQRRRSKMSYLACALLHL